MGRLLLPFSRLVGFRLRVRPGATPRSGALGACPSRAEVTFVVLRVLPPPASGSLPPLGITIALCSPSGGLSGFAAPGGRLRRPLPKRATARAPPPPWQHRTPPPCTANTFFLFFLETRIRTLTRIRQVILGKKTARAVFPRAQDFVSQNSKAVLDGCAPVTYLCAKKGEKSHVAT